MRGGDLDQYVTFQSSTVTRDALNGRVIAWGDEAVNVPVQIRMLSGREVNSADQITAATTLAVIIRKGLPVVPQWRILWSVEGVVRTLNIEAVLPHEKRDRWTLLCSEGLNNG